MTVATTSFLGERNGTRFEVIVEIGQPYRCSDIPEEWACLVALRGLYDKLADMHGGDALQALCLAVRLALSLLSAFKDEGGKILDRDGKDVSFESYVPKGALS
jgi:hypothetical protein